MKKDIDLKDLIKIVSDVQSKYREKPVVKQETRVNNDSEIKRIFNSNASTLQKLNELKIYEQSNPPKGLKGMQDLFYFEAKLLEDIKLYEDYYNSFYNTAGVLSQFDTYASYRKMTLLELKRYLTWRTKLRNGIFTFTNSKFIYTYVNEIYRLIGVKNKNEGFDILMFMLDNLILLSPRNENIFKQVVLEYIYVHNIEIEKTMSYDLFKKLFIFKESILSKEENYADDVTEYIFSSYSNETNFFILYQKEIRNILNNVINNISKYLKNNNSSIVNLIYKVKEKTESIKYASVFIPSETRNRLEKRTSIKISGCLDIEFSDIYVHYKELVYEYKYSSICRYMIHRIEYLLRKKYHDRSIKKKEYPNIAVTNDFDKLITDQKFINFIEKVIEKETSIPSVSDIVEIDLSKLDTIREVSNEVSQKLITEFDLEEEIIINTPVVVEKSNDIWINLKNSLTEVEKTFLKLLVKNESIIRLKDYCKLQNILIEVLIEAINEKSMDSIEDNLIEMLDDEIIIYDEYIENINEMLEGE